MLNGFEFDAIGWFRGFRIQSRKLSVASEGEKEWWKMNSPSQLVVVRSKVWALINTSHLLPHVARVRPLTSTLYLGIECRPPGNCQLSYATQHAISILQGQRRPTKISRNLFAVVDSSLWRRMIFAICNGPAMQLECINRIHCEIPTGIYAATARK